MPLKREIWPWPASYNAFLAFLRAAGGKSSTQDIPKSLTSALPNNMTHADLFICVTIPSGSTTIMQSTLAFNISEWARNSAKDSI